MNPNTLLTLVKEGYSIVDILTIIIIIAIIIVCIEKTIKWCWDKFTILYNRKKGIEDKENLVNQNSIDIESLSQKIDDLASLLNKQYTHLEKKIDEQGERIEKLDIDRKTTDRSVLRDRILQGMRYFSQNKDESGRVHISLTDYENMDSLFSSYFECEGNGGVKHIYTEEFIHFIIDN